jgi:hypothetical protein
MMQQGKKAAFARGLWELPYGVECLAGKTISVEWWLAPWVLAWSRTA